MSVINQMLKDLEQRTPENAQAGAAPVIIPAKTSPVKIILITVIIFLSINAIGWYVWQLNVENKSLKEQQVNKEVVSAVVEDKLASKVTLPPRAEPPATKKIATPVINKVTTENISGNSRPKEKTELASSVLATQAEKSAPEPIKQAPIKPEPKSTNPKSSNSNPSIDDRVKRAILAKAPTSMSVSRRQLTADELIAQKLTQAERFLAENSVAKAEQLFEEILIIEPNHKQARKKLAALWFGRKAYQEAINLLSQGIALAPQDSELRTMKAQIYLKQGKSTLAFNTLMPLAELEQQEYQILLANVAQDISQHQAAIEAYQLLIKMQPYSGRWHLGLAIVFDKDSQFAFAVQEYNLALTKADLSASSAKFAQQRIQALVK